VFLLYFHNLCFVFVFFIGCIVSLVAFLFPIFFYSTYFHPAYLSLIFLIISVRFYFLVILSLFLFLTSTQTFFFFTLFSSTFFTLSYQYLLVASFHLLSLPLFCFFFLCILSHYSPTSNYLLISYQCYLVFNFAVLSSSVILSSFASYLSWKLFLNIVLETDSQIFTFFRKEKCSF
jgi:hypothetical protein